MSKFDDFWNEGFNSYDCPYDAARDTFNYKQAEIDELQHKVKCEREISLFADKLCCDLQKRIDGAVKYIEPSDELSHKAYRDLIKILKGKTNEQ